MEMYDDKKSDDFQLPFSNDFILTKTMKDAYIRKGEREIP